MFCNNCGKRISDQAKFCDYCGAKVAVCQPRANGAASRQAPPQTNNYRTPSQPAPAKKENSWGKRILSWVMAALVYFGVRYGTEMFLTRDVKKPEPAVADSSVIQLQTEAKVSLTDSCFYGALYENDYVTYGLARLYLPGYYLLPGEGDETDWLMSDDNTCLFSASKQLEVMGGSFSATDEESILGSAFEEGIAYELVDFQKINVDGYPVVRYIALFIDAETDQYVGEIIVFPGETVKETLRLAMCQEAESGYDKITQAFDSLSISEAYALSAADTGTVGLNRITVK